MDRPMRCPISMARSESGLPPDDFNHMIHQMATVQHRDEEAGSKPPG